MSYIPPVTSLTFQQLLETTSDKIAPVSCENCPVNMPCIVANLDDKLDDDSSASGLYCESCGATSIITQRHPESGKVENVLILDCDKHRFPRAAERYRQCGLCDGQIMRLYVSSWGAVNHYVPTVHARVSLEKRKEVLAETYKYWSKINALEEAEKAEKAAKKKVAADET